MSQLKKKMIKGFTLIELMIVVAIIGILAAVAIPKFADLVTKSKEAAVKGTIGSLRSAISIYYGDNEGNYPVNLFNSLTDSNKYLPPVAGVSSLGKYPIPKVASNSNPGHDTSALWANASAIGAYGTDSTQRDLAGPLYYNEGTGDVYVNCGHYDTKNNPWSSY